jgi:DNA-directed RNA polymerase subunit RPC12/RpoP
MHKCSQCGGTLRRVHRRFFERFGYLAIYACKECQNEEFVPRRYKYHFGPHARCPNCGTLRIVKLKEPDKIDPMHVGFLNFLERMFGGRLFHCRYCRCQFYDRRRTAAETPVPATKPVADPPVTSPQGTASSDV